MDNNPVIVWCRGLSIIIAIGKYQQKKKIARPVSPKTISLQWQWIGSIHEKAGQEAYFFPLLSRLLALLAHFFFIKHAPLRTRSFAPTPHIFIIFIIVVARKNIALLLLYLQV